MKKNINAIRQNNANSLIWNKTHVIGCNKTQVTRWNQLKKWKLKLIFGNNAELNIKNYLETFSGNKCYEFGVVGISGVRSAHNFL